jgi:hypothetical protein
MKRWDWGDVTRRKKQDIAVAVLAIGGVTVLLAGLAYEAWYKSPQHASVLAGLLSAAAGAIAWTIRVVHRRWGAFASIGDLEKELNQAARDFAYVVERRWEVEADRQQLTSPPLKVEWSAASSEVAADLRETMSRDGLNIGECSNPPSDLLGSWDTVAEKFMERISVGIPRLVILGRPGAGKTVLALHLQRQLLDLHREGLAVPVLLPMASWNPEGENLYSWAASRLADLYPELPELGRTMGSRRNSPTVAEELLRTHRVLLILDGLDQMPTALHPGAIRALNGRRVPDYPLVLTCRSDAYANAVGADSKRTQNTDIRDVLARAAVIELHPLSPEQIEPYLISVAPERESEESRWKPVLRRLKQQPDGPLAVALSTPLMVWLARTVYEAADPARLLEFDRGHSNDHEKLEGHLLDDLIPARYAERVTRDEGFCRWDPRDAQRWLIFLARQLDGQKLGDNPGDLAWWQLHNAAKRAIMNTAGIAAGLVVGVAVGLGFGLLFGTIVGVVSGLVVGILIGLESRGSSLGPAKVEIRLRGRLGRSLIAGLTVGIVGGIAGWVKAGIRFGVATGFALGFPVGFAYGLVGPADIKRATSPDSVLKRDRAFVFLFGIVYGVVCGLVGGSRRGPFFGFVFGLSAGLAGGLMYGPLWVIVFKLFRREGLEPEIGVSAWFRFLLARAWLAASRQLPFRLMTFLNDACARQVLRQVGPVYQFRHERLRARLRGPAPGSYGVEPSTPESGNRQGGLPSDAPQ